MNTKLTLRLKPITSKLYGSLKGAVLSKNDYKKHIEQKLVYTARITECYAIQTYNFLTKYTI